MNMESVFVRDCLVPGATPGNKKETLQLVAKLAAESGHFPGYSEKQIYRALDDRERAGSTGFENGVALPHCSLESLDRFVAGVITVPEGVDFDALDGNPSYIVFFVIGPPDRRNEHIHLISAISRHALDESFRSSLLEADDSATLERLIHKTFTEEDGEEEESRCIFHIFVQRSEPFEELLRVFSAAVPGSLCVLDGGNAGSYVQRMPLYSSFWTDSRDRFFKVIIAVVNDRLQNDLIRRINTIVPDVEETPGVMYTVQPVTYVAGSLEY